MPQEIRVELDDALTAAIDLWIARHDDPKPTRAEAVVHLLTGLLGTNHPSTVIPNLVTGRDIL